MDKVLAQQVANFWAQEVRDDASMTEVLVASLLTEVSAQAGMMSALQAQQEMGMAA